MKTPLLNLSFLGPSPEATLPPPTTISAGLRRAFQEKTDAMTTAAAGDRLLEPDRDLGRPEAVPRLEVHIHCRNLPGLRGRPRRGFSSGMRRRAISPNGRPCSPRRSKRVASKDIALLIFRLRDEWLRPSRAQVVVEDHDAPGRFHRIPQPVQ